MLSNSRRTAGRRSLSALAALLVGLATLSACGHVEQGANSDPTQVDAVVAPTLGSCRQLTTGDVAMTSNATRTVDCTKPHTAQTYAVGDLPDSLRETAYDSPDLGRFAYQTCTSKLQKFLGADESTAMRTVLTWAWFRPTQDAWDHGARWYRCDLVGNDGPSSLLNLPASGKGLLSGRPDDHWLACVAGASVDGAPRIPCSRKHDWRAVTTIKLGEPGDPYPGDHVSEVRTREFCSGSVSAWLNYPIDYDYGYTWFHQAEWDAGNRRSICWAKTGT